MTLPRDFVRFTNDSEVFGIDATVVVITHSFDDAGEIVTTETDISAFVMAAEIPYMKVGEISRVRLDVLCKGVSHSATVVDLLAKSFEPRKRGLRRRLRDWRDGTWKSRNWSLKAPA